MLEEDPVRDHVLPSRKEPPRGSGRELMPPPAPRAARPGGKGVRRPAEALDEETFVEAMGEIIERDFFPELPRLQRQVKWLEAVERGGRRVESLTDVRRAVQSEMRRDSASAEAFSSSTSSSVARSVGGGGAATPLVGGSFSSASSVASGAGREGEDGAGAGAQGGALPVSLDQFLARFQSEDDAAFDTLAEKMRAAHRRKYWWVYEPPGHQAIEAGKEKLYLLPSGEFMSAEARAAHVVASDAKPRLGDDRPNGPETWPYRPKNALMFHPELEEVRAWLVPSVSVLVFCVDDVWVCRSVLCVPSLCVVRPTQTQPNNTHPTATQPQTAKVYTSKPEGAAALGREGPVMLLTENGEPFQPASGAGNGHNGAIVPATAASANARVGEAAKPPKEVVHTNTRFAAEFKKRAGFLPSPLERLASDMSSFSTDTSLSSEAGRPAANDSESRVLGRVGLSWVYVQQGPYLY